jgi:hypothetical protein
MPLNGPPERAAAQKAAINDLLDSGSLSTSGIAPFFFFFLTCQFIVQRRKAYVTHYVL